MLWSNEQVGFNFDSSDEMAPCRDDYCASCKATSSVDELEKRCEADYKVSHVCHGATVPRGQGFPELLVPFLSGTL